MLAGWQVLGVGVGGYVRRRITPIPRPGLLRYPGRRITGLYLTTHIKDVIISVAMITKRLLVTRTATMALYGVLPLSGINSRRTPKNAVQRIYINYGNTKRLELYSIQGHKKTLYLYKAIRAVC